MKKESEVKTEDGKDSDVKATTPEIKVDQVPDSESPSTESQGIAHTELSDSGISDNDQDFEYEFDINRYFNTKIQLNMGRPARTDEIAEDDEVISL